MSDVDDELPALVRTPNQPWPIRRTVSASGRMPFPLRVEVGTIIVDADGQIIADTEDGDYAVGGKKIKVVKTNGQKYERWEGGEAEANAELLVAMANFGWKQTKELNAKRK